MAIKKYASREQIEEWLDKGFNLSVPLSPDVQKTIRMARGMDSIAPEDLLYLLDYKDNENARKMVFYFSFRYVVYWAVYYSKKEDFLNFFDVLSGSSMGIFSILDNWDPKKGYTTNPKSHFFWNLRRFAYDEMFKTHYLIDLPSQIKYSYNKNKDIFYKYGSTTSLDVWSGASFYVQDVCSYLDHKSMRRKIHKILLSIPERRRLIYYDFLKTESLTETATHFGITKQAVQTSLRKTLEVIFRRLGRPYEPVF